MGAPRRTHARTHARTTKVGAIGNFVAYYVVGLPLGWMMCFKWGHGVTGLWDGMLAGLAVADAIFVWCICRSDWKPKDS